jgi:predicted CXXCH cytochrome family protein
VLGDFGGATFSYNGITSTFVKRDGTFHVSTDGPDGKLHDYRIEYTFGVHPLQQYLVALRGGRYQALGIAWDSRPRSRGGQRWFHLYPDENIAHDDELHWTGPSQNWNFMCADCHSTHLQKNYDPHADRFRTTWAALNVSCEACHGPGSAHVRAAEPRAHAGRSPEGTGRGLQDLQAPPDLLVRLEDASGGDWRFEPGAATASPTRSRAGEGDLQVEICARCHARRTRFSDDDWPGRPLLDSYLPALLEEGLYYADGQIQDEVYEYGSFRQSRMYQAGVVCSDCHEPHGLGLRAPGDQVCRRCHAPAVFAAPGHHFHRADSAGASCIGCHMPARTYMLVDPRLDHSIRVPRPDLSVELGTPSACNQCHIEKGPMWAADAAAKWWPGRRSQPHYGQALQAGRLGAPGAEEALIRLATDGSRPAVVRATAVALLGGYPSSATLQALHGAARDADAQIRHAAAGAMGAFPLARRLDLAKPMLGDPVRLVRIEAARAIADASRSALSETEQRALARGIEGYVAAQQTNSDRAFARVNLGNLRLQLGDMAAAEAEYRSAMRLEPRSPAGYVNLADLYRAQGREEDCRSVLQAALQAVPRSAEVHHAYGLFLVRQGQRAQAIEAFARAVRLQPRNARFAYVYAVALHDAGESASAVAVLEDARRRRPYDRDLLYALATIHRDRGAGETALRYARELAALAPHDASIRQLVEALER